MVGDKIRDLRKKIGMTQEQLAGHELTKSYVSQVELGRIRPSRKALEIMAQRLGKPLGYFLDNDDDLRTVDVLLKASEALFLSHRTDEALVGLEEARYLAERMGRDDILAKIETTIGELELSRGNFPEAMEHLRTALDSLSLEDAPEQVVDTATALGRAASQAGLFHEAVAHFHHSVNVARATNNRELKVHALKCYGDFCFERREWLSALTLYQEATLEEGNKPSVDLEIRMAATQCRLNDLAKAEPLVVEALEKVDQLPRDEARFRLLVDVARCCIPLKKYDEAYHLIEESLSGFIRSHASSRLLAPALEAGLNLAQASQNHTWADHYIASALEQPADPVFNPVKAQACVLKAEITFNPEETLKHLARALQFAPERHDVVLKQAATEVRAGIPGAVDDLWKAVWQRYQAPQQSFLSAVP